MGGDRSGNWGRGGGRCWGGRRGGGAGTGTGRGRGRAGQGGGGAGLYRAQGSESLRVGSGLYGGPRSRLLACPPLLLAPTLAVCECGGAAPPGTYTQVESGVDPIWRVRVAQWAQLPLGTDSDTSNHARNTRLSSGQ